MRRSLLITMSILSVGCIGDEPSLGGPSASGLDASSERGSLEAQVVVRSGFEDEQIDVVRGDIIEPFVAEEVIANLTLLGGEEQVVISGLSGDRTRSLALVLDTRELNDSAGSTDLSLHGAVYMESGFLGEPLLFDGTPQGTLEWAGDWSQGSSLAGSFSVLVPTYDRDGEGNSDLFVELVGSFDVHLLEETLE